MAKSKIVALNRNGNNQNENSWRIISINVKANEMKESVAQAKKASSAAVIVKAGARLK
jgi:hypothetical protein